MKNYTQQEIEQLEKKANDWDQLGKEIERCYIDDENDPEYGLYNGEADLLTIGELAATAYGYL